MACFHDFGSRIPGGLGNVDDNEREAGVVCVAADSSCKRAVGLASTAAFRSEQHVREGIVVGVRYCRQFAVLVLLLVSCLAPAMACMVPNAQMSTQERACCSVMKSQCGQMEMPVSHGCCQKTPPSVRDNALDTKPVTLHPGVVPVIWLAASVLVNPVSTVAEWVDRPDYSPPKSPPSTISILRI